MTRNKLNKPKASSLILVHHWLQSHKNKEEFDMKYDELARKLRDRIDKGIGERVHDVIERVRISSPCCLNTTCNARLVSTLKIYLKEIQTESLVTLSWAFCYLGH